MRTVRSNREIEAIFLRGRRVAHPLVVALYSPTDAAGGRGGRVAFVAGKKIGGAVSRNRAKRVLRAAARRTDAPWAGYDVVLIARVATGEARPEDLDEAITAVLRRGDVT